MSIKTLVSYIGEANIADQVDDDTLVAIGQRVARQYQEDLSSMDSWLESVKNGVELMRQEWNTKSTPWEGASNYKDPLLTQASIQFGDKAVLEILRGKDLISSEIVGKDPEGQKKARSERVVEAMNYQVNHDMNKWRKKQERLLYTLPNTGTMFKKTVYDPIEQIAESHIIQYPDFVVNQATEDMEECRSFSQVLDVSDNEIEVRVRSGRWLELKAQIDKGQQIDKEGDTRSNEQQGVIDTIDNPDKFIEQQTFFDLDDDGYEEPYVVTIHERSQQVVRIVARFDEKSIMVKMDDHVMALPEALQMRESEEVEGFGGGQLMSLLGLAQPETDPDSLELLKIVPFQHITKYGFIPAPDGTFLDLGYSHLLGSIVQSINTSTNQLTDAGTLANVGGGLLSKEFRKSMGINKMKTGQYIKTEVTAEKMAKGVFPNPSKEPSQTLFALNQQMRQKGGEFLAITDISGRINAQTAPTTALAIIQESMIPTSALFKRILDAESEEFQVLFRINQRTFSEQKYQQILDDEQANAKQDFNSEGIDIVPTANAEMSSKMHRIQVAELELQQFPLVLQTGGNPVPIVKSYFESIGSTLISQIFPEEGSMSPAEQQQLQKMQQAQELQNQIQQQQLEILTREQDRLDADTQKKIEKMDEEIDNIAASTIERFASAAEKAEKAETEALKNQITTYSQQLVADFNYDPMTGSMERVS
jgi:chaperonin GroES